MVRLFSTILRREPDGGHVLVTPGEKLAIAVEDTPFRAVEMKSEGEGEHRTLVFRLDTDDLVMAGADHPLSFGGDADNPDPRPQGRSEERRGGKEGVRTCRSRGLP